MCPISVVLLPLVPASSFLLWDCVSCRLTRTARRTAGLPGMLQVLHAGENYGMGNAAVTNAPECFAIHAGSITIYPPPLCVWSTCQSYYHVSTDFPFLQFCKRVSFGGGRTLAFEMFCLLAVTCANTPPCVNELHFYFSTQFCLKGRALKLGRGCQDRGRRSFHNKAFYIKEAMYPCKPPASHGRNTYF